MKRLLSVKNLLLFVMIFAISLTGFSKKKIVASSWIGMPLSIDGSHTDWTDVTFTSAKRLSIDYGFKNDGENLYVIFIFRESRYLSTIRSTGMTIWFNSEGKKKRNCGIKFTKEQVSAEEFISYLEQRKGPLPEEEKNEIRSRRNYFLHKITVVGKKSKSSRQVYDKGEIKPAVFRTAEQKDATVYEFAIPLKRVAEKAPGIGTEPGKIVKVGFEWGGITEEMKAARIKRLKGAGGTPGKLVSTSDKSRKSAGVTRSRQGPKKYTIWVDVQLAKNQ
jgi:hypothetical protein